MATCVRYKSGQFVVSISITVAPTYTCTSAFVLDHNTALQAKSMIKLKLMIKLAVSITANLNEGHYACLVYLAVGQ